MFVCQTCNKKTTRWKRCDEHYLCDDCGTRESLCTYTEGVLCKPCKKARVDAREADFEGDTDYTGEAICPYCGYKHRDSWEMSEGERDCPDCEKTFELTRNVEVTYSTSKVDSK